MEAAELKTPLRAPKKYKRNKQRADEVKIEEFMSFGSSNYFSHLDKDGCDRCVHSELTFSSKEIKSVERRIEEWLSSRGIHQAAPSQKKECFFEERRERVNSISFCEHLADSNTIDCSPNNKALSMLSFQLSPQNSKICRKRTGFTSLANLEMQSAAKIENRTQPLVKSDHKPISQSIIEEDESPVFLCNRRSDVEVRPQLPNTY